jgi:hypothetical protein
VRRPLVVSLALAVALIAAGSNGAGAATCAYPGDDATQETIAIWMGAGAREAGLPAELPVMAALVDSGMRNLSQGDSTTAGYFQMRVDIWDKGDYAGFREHATLQLQWFIDQALAVRQRRIAAGDVGYGSDPAHWGEWVADVQRPAEQYRGRYQLRLDDARALTASGCSAQDPEPQPSDPPPTDPGSPPPPDQQLIADSVLPRLDVQARRYQDAARIGAVKVTVICTYERCLARAAASIAVPKRGVFRMAAWPVQLARGQKQTFRLRLDKGMRKLVGSAQRKGTCPLGAVRIVAANAGGYRNSSSRTVVIGRSARACAS